MKMQVVDFRNTEFGLLVKYSPHWIKECNYKPNANKIGMVTAVAFYKDATGRIICWPIIQWEGSPTGFACHPSNVIPWRKRQLQKANWIEITL